MLETFWEKIWKSSKFKKWLRFSNSKLLPYPSISILNLAKYCFQKPKTLQTTLIWEDRSFSTEKKILYFVSKVLSKILHYSYFLKKNAPNYWIILKCTFLHGILKVQSIPSYKSDLYALMFIFSIKIWYFWWLSSSDGYLQF